MTNDPTRANNAQVQIKHGYVYGDGPTNYPVGTKMPDDIKDAVERLNRWAGRSLDVANQQDETFQHCDTYFEIGQSMQKAIAALTTLSEENAAMKAFIKGIAYKGSDGEIYTRVHGDSIVSDLYPAVKDIFKDAS